VIQASAVPFVSGVFADPLLDEIIKPPGFDLTSLRPDVIAINGLTPERIERDGRGIEGLANLCLTLVDPDPEVKMIVVAHNWAFDRAAIESEMRANGIEIDLSGVLFIDTLTVVRHIYDEGWDGYGGQKLPNMKLGTCFYALVPQDRWDRLPRDLAPHDSFYDVHLCGMLLEVLLEKLSVEDLIELSKTVVIPRTCPIGKEKGKPWAEVDHGFLRWMVNNRIWDKDEGLELAVLEEAERRGLI
jgi:DNA polymerase III epsilon subunit-like protein